MEKHSSSMQLTRRADYAVGALIYLAELYEGARVVLPELARVTEAPEDFIYKISPGFATGRFGRIMARKEWRFRNPLEGLKSDSQERSATSRSAVSSASMPIRS